MRQEELESRLAALEEKRSFFSNVLDQVRSDLARCQMTDERICIAEQRVKNASGALDMICDQIENVSNLLSRI